MDHKELYSNYLKDIYRYCFYKLRNKEEAEDVTGETFTRYIEHKAPDTIRDKKLWLIEVARNIIYRKYRKDQISTNLTEGLENTIVDEEEIHIDTQIVQQEIIDDVRSRLDRLEPLFKEVIVLKVWEDLTFNEIAQILNINENSVKTMYYRGLKQIKTDIDRDVIKKGVSLGVLAAAILKLKDEISVSEEFIASQISQASNLIINSSNMNTSVSLLSKLKTIFAANPIVGGGTVVGGVSVIVGVTVVVTSVLSPVTLGPSGEYQSGGLIKNYSATINFKNESTDETFNCNSNGCDSKYSNYGIPDGEYYSTVIIKNMFGQEVGREEKKVTVDSISPTVELTYPEFTNKSEVEIKITVDEEVTVFINNEEKTLDNGIVKVNLDDGVNNLSIKVVDNGKNEVVKDITITLDTIIELNITAPQDGAEVDSKFTVSGTTDAGATVSSQGVSTTALEDGTFTLELTYSTSKVDITSTDKAGNTLTKSINVKSKGPTTLTYTGKNMNFSFNYSSALGAVTTKDNLGNEGVYFAKYGAKFLTKRKVAYPTITVTEVSREPGPKTKNGYISEIIVWRIIEDVDNPANNGTYIVAGDIGTSAQQCTGSAYGYPKLSSDITIVKNYIRQMISSYTFGWAC